MGKESDAQEAISNEQIVAVAHKAGEEMRETWNREIKPHRRPSVMTALQVGEQIYLASSMKGEYSFIYEYKIKDKNGKTGNGQFRNSVPSEIKDALEEARCEAGDESPARTNVQHKNDASCGELMASYTYLLKNGNIGLRNKQPKPRTIAWLYTKGTDNEVDKAWDPCGGGDETWGCDLFCSQMGFETISASTKEAETFPKITKTEQQELMTKDMRDEVDQRDKEDDEERKRKQKEGSAKKKTKGGEQGQKEGQEDGKMKNQNGKGKHARAWIS